MVNALWADWATESPGCFVPVSVAGGNPTIDAAGHTPTSPVTLLGPALVTDGVAARSPKLQAAPSGTAAAAPPAPPGFGQTGEVVNVHTKLAVSPLPNVSCAPVVIVAV